MNIFSYFGGKFPEKDVLRVFSHHTEYMNFLMLVDMINFCDFDDCVYFFYNVYNLYGIKP